MSKKIIFNLLLCAICFVSCDDGRVSSSDVNSIEDISSSESSFIYSSSEIETYTVTWKNYNGDILEIDEDVIYGDYPSYDGEKPTKNEGDVVYKFIGWSPDISKVVSDITYIALFEEVKSNENWKPIIDNDKGIVQYGLYPQSYVSDSDLIESLNELDEISNVNDWYFYDGNYYVKMTSKVYLSNSYCFNDGTKIMDDSEYWFKCEPIEWNILNVDNQYFLLSSMLLDVHSFYESYRDRIVDNELVYANNYFHSDIRKWLNDDFYNIAFALDNSYIEVSLIHNDSTTTDISDNKYICNDCLDNVFLPSYQDYLNSEYGFDMNNGISSTRECRVSDYAIAKGAWIDEKTFNSSYWTRSPSSEFNYCAWNVNTGGYLSSYVVDGNDHCVRPCIVINFDN